MKGSSNKTKDSHDLSYLLRHDNTCKLETGGWRSVENLVHEQGFTFEQLCELVANDSKGRFEFNNDKTKIRALYGHSVPVEMNYARCTPPEILYHGTSMNADASMGSFSLGSSNRKIIKVACDSRNIIEVLSRDSTISSLCEIVYWTEMSWSMNTVEEMLGNQLHIFVVTDTRDMTTDFVQQVSNFDKYTSGIILISPVIVEQIPSIQATSREEINSILHSLSLLAGRNRPGNLSLQDIATLLLNVDGEIKVLQTAYNDSSDITNLCEKLTASLKGQDVHFKFCIVQVAMPEWNGGPTERIQTDAWNIGECVRNMTPDTGCYFCYSDNMPGDRQIHISVFLH
ncbi:MAG: RNA 2'-phosphotransferase [Parabacteroides distasonis]